MNKYRREALKTNIGQWLVIAFFAFAILNMILLTVKFGWAYSWNCSKSEMWHGQWEMWGEIFSGSFSRTPGCGR